MCAALERLVTGAQPASLLGLTWALSTTLSRCPGACCAVCCVLCDGAGVALQRDWCAGCCCPSQGPDSPHAAGPGQLPYRAPRQPAAGSPAGTCRGCCPRPVRPGQPLLVKGGRGTGCVLAAVVTREREERAMPVWVSCCGGVGWGVLGGEQHTSSCMCFVVVGITTGCVSSGLC